MQNKLLEILRERDISQSELANLTKISRNTIGAICRNATDSIRFEVLESILNVLGITPNEFFSVAESTKKPTKIFVKEYSDAYTLSSVDSLNRDIYFCRMGVLKLKAETLEEVMQEINHLVTTHDYPLVVVQDIWLRLQGNQCVGYAKQQLRYLENVKKYKMDEEQVK